MAPTLTSEKNPLLKQVRRAAARGSLTEDGFALAEGPHLLDEALRSGVEIAAVIAVESAVLPGGTDPRRPPSGAPPGEPPATRILRISDAAFAALASTETPQGVLTLVRPPAWTMADLLRGTPLVVILDGVQDPGNAGAILRAAEAFGASGAIFLKGTVNPYNPKCLRGSAGSIFRLPVLAGLNDGELPAGLPWYAADPRAAATVSQARLDGACALLIGAEGAGVSPALLARATGIRIPTAGVESLNAALAAGILLYEARRQRGVP